MKVLLLNSPIYRTNTEANEDYLPSLGLCYIATHLKEAGIEIEFIDCVREHLGVDEIHEILFNDPPDYLALNVFSQNLHIVREIAEGCPINTKVILGGQVVKAIYNDILTWKVINGLIIIIGESELILPDIVEGNCREVPFFSSENKQVYLVDSSSSYYPYDLSKVHLDRSFIKNDTSVNHYGQKEAAIITSRGCSYNCAFCGAARSKNCDTSIRIRPSAAIVSEIDALISSHPDLSSIRILDDLFLRDDLSIESAIILFSAYSRITWRGMAHVLTFVKSLSLLPALHDSGCRELFIGVESGSDKVRNMIHKAGTSEQVTTVVTSILTTGIDVKIYLMYGFPNETYSDAMATYILAKKLKLIAMNTKGNLRTSVFQFRPYHGTELYDDILKSGKNIDTVKSNEHLNVYEKRTQFNFQCGNFSELSDTEINEFVLKTQALSDSTLFDLIRECDICDLRMNQPPLLDRAHKCDVLWVGLSAKKIKDENETPLSSTTKSGSIINLVTQSCKGISMYRTNIVKCLPLDDRSRLRHPEKTEMERCFVNFESELTTLSPKIVFLLGDKVAKLVAKQFQIKFPVLTAFNFTPIQYGSIFFIHVYHPSHIHVYKRKRMGDYIDALKSIVLQYAISGARNEN